MKEWRAKDPTDNINGFWPKEFRGDKAAEQRKWNKVDGGDEG